MSEDFGQEACKRESTLQEEIEALEKYGVPDHVRGRMVAKANALEKWAKDRENRAEKEVQFAVERNQNLGAVVDALGDYINRKNTRDW